jgi:serine/threonine protein kinase
VVVKRYKTGHGIDTVQLKRRMAAVKRNSPFGLCSMYEVLEDKTKGELSVLMEVYRGDLRNLIDLKMDYLMKKDGHAQEEMVIIMPFKYNLTLDIMKDIACGMKTLHQISGVIQKDLKASNILVVLLVPDAAGGLWHRKPSRDVELEQYFISE